eukprot:1157471-Pelagomonas_calceolata.AAC.3
MLPASAFKPVRLDAKHAPGFDATKADAMCIPRMTRELEAGGFENDAELLQAKKAQAFASKGYAQKRFGEKGSSNTGKFPIDSTLIGVLSCSRKSLWSLGAENPLQHGSYTVEACGGQSGSPALVKSQLA